MFLYIDSFFAEPRDREVNPLNEIPDTLNQLYLLAMREHDREAVYSERTDDRWLKHPDWRLDRSVIRLSLFMQSRFGLEPGDRVAIVGPAGPGWFLADLAVMTSGAITVAVPDGAGSDALAEVLVDVAPSVAFLSPSALESVQSVRGSLPSLKHLVAFGAEAEVEEDGIVPFQGVLDLGGTLDTPERAQQFRAVARATASDAVATVQYETTPEMGRGRGRLQSQELTQGDIIDRIRQHLTDQPADRGDTAYVSGREMMLNLRLGLYAFMGDGYTTTAFGTPGGETEDCKELAPDKVLLPASVLAEVARSENRARTGGKAGSELVRKAFGGRVTWVGSTEPLDTETVNRIGNISAVAADGAA